ncbi:MAG TPA: hypothetical protein VHI71_09000 [Actinomycetota bacterium]|nr:hypothetical protein [Actinomycetota bacterium]
MKKILVTVALATALVTPAAPARADHVGPLVHTQECPPGYVGRTIYVVDRGLIWGCYRLP